MWLTKRKLTLLLMPLACGGMLFSTQAGATPDVNNPAGFFTSVADKMLRNTFAFGITNIPVYSNGVFVYTPAVQRLLQFSANIFDASNTNTFPSVFRPRFGKDASSNIFIVGYMRVTNVSGVGDSQLSPPYDVSQLASATMTPISDAHGPVNVYGVPWIIGAKKGFPGFNQLSLVNVGVFTRKLQVLRTTTDPTTAIYATNQMYVMTVSNNIGISFWNPYSNAYPHSLTICASDVMQMTLTNRVFIWSSNTNFVFTATVNSWPGAQWTGNPSTSTPNSSSFITANWSCNFLNPSVYRFNSASFDPIGSGASSNFETTSPTLPQLPQFGLSATNYLQAFILDGTNVIDYVQLGSPVGSGNLNAALADSDFPSPSGIFYQWSTNTYQSQSCAAPYGVINQLFVSGHCSYAPTSGGQWSIAPTPMGQTSPSAESSYFNGFFTPNFQYNGQTYVNNQLAIQAPYTPIRYVVSSCLFQANDPLIHYLASDLDSQYGATAIWGNNHIWQNGVWSHTDDLQTSPLPMPPTTPIGGRYQPWLRVGQMNRIPSVVTNGYAYKDPLVYGPDFWNFPTNLLLSLAGLGQVHRGTPWQTFYLKDVDLLGNSSGLNTWMQWTGDFNTNDAMLTAPVIDRPLAGLLMSVLNTNDPTQLFSVNDPSPADWQNILNGLTVYSNSTPIVVAATPVQFDTYILAGNSSQASIIANGVAQARIDQSGQKFYSIGDICATPELAFKSPFLNLGNSGFGQQQTNYGITDIEYEALPAQLLPLLRPDSFGVLARTNGSLGVSFSGADGYAYAVQASTNLINWNTICTNYPLQGSFAVSIKSATNLLNYYFYRSVLLP